MDDTFVEAFWDHVCAAKPLWYLLLALAVTLLLLLAFSFRYIDEGSAAYVVAVISAAVLVPSLVTAVAIIYRCDG